mmetsp:Transcript_33622/g.70697  ORF Transcript_33622/g.70697 Transcript_33622/m.70697 type:complete len:93 (-) Transcript_33622:116-394(-)
MKKENVAEAVPLLSSVSDTTTIRNEPRSPHEYYHEVFHPKQEVAPPIMIHGLYQQQRKSLSTPQHLQQSPLTNNRLLQHSFMKGLNTSMKYC